MRDRIFIDTNIFVYAYLENPKKQEDYEKHYNVLLCQDHFQIYFIPSINE